MPHYDMKNTNFFIVVYPQASHSLQVNIIECAVFCSSSELLFYVLPLHFIPMGAPSITNGVSVASDTMQVQPSRQQMRELHFFALLLKPLQKPLQTLVDIPFGGGGFSGILMCRFYPQVQLKYLTQIQQSR